MGIERRRRLADLSEKVLNERAALDGRDAKFEYVFYPSDRHQSVVRRLDTQVLPDSVADYYDTPPRVLPDCRLKAVIEGVGETKCGLVDVYILGNSKAVERLRELTALAGRLIPDKFSGLDQYMAPGETARERAHCLALIARLSIGPTEDHGIQTLTAECDGDEYHVAVVEDGFWAVHSLLQVFDFVDESAAGGTKRKRSRRQPGDTDLKIQKLTAKQTEAMQLFGECSGNYTAIGKRMGIGRKTAEGHVKAAFKKLGKMVPQRKTRTTSLPNASLPNDRRGQANVVQDSDGEAKVIQNGRRTKPVRDD